MFGPLYFLLLSLYLILCTVFLACFCFICTFFFCPFTSDKTDLESTHSSNMSSGQHTHNSLEKQVIPPDALYSSNEKIVKNSNAGYISYEAVFNDSKVSRKKSMENLAIIWWFLRLFFDRELSHSLYSRSWKKKLNLVMVSTLSIVTQPTWWYWNDLKVKYCTSFGTFCTVWKTWCVFCMVYLFSWLFSRKEWILIFI